MNREKEKWPRNNAIDIALARLLEETPRGKELTQEEIADACGCSRQYIYALEQRAMKKLRRCLKRADLKEAFL